MKFGHLSRDAMNRVCTIVSLVLPSPLAYDQCFPADCQTYSATVDCGR